MIQLTTIRGMYIPSAALRLGKKPSIKSCTTVTKEATITMNAGIRTLSGITFLNIDINQFDIIRTTRVESPIPNPLTADVVTARVGHIPSISTKVGFSFTIPLYNLSIDSFITIPPYLI